MLELKNINIRFNNKECIRNGHFVAYNSQITSIIGESGTGKSSLLYIISMISDFKCDYYYNNELISNTNKDEFRNKYISFITQDSKLIENINIKNNLEFYLKISGASYNTDELLKKVNLLDKKEAMPNNLSGGERQRAAIACAIAKDSDIILGDEITSALDKEHKKLVMKLLRELADSGKIVILVSHERDIVNESDRVYKIDHLKLSIDKDSVENSVTNTVREVQKLNKVEIFELLFHSNNKYNLRRIGISFLIVCILFINGGITTLNIETMNAESYSTENLSLTKIIVYNNEDEELSNDVLGTAIHQEDAIPLLSDDLEILNELEHISDSYDYFTFSYDMLYGDGRYHNMDIEIIKEDMSSVSSSSDSYDFYIVPVYKDEENLLSDKGVYINSNMAYYYNIEVGDTLELTLNVPYALNKYIDAQVNEFGHEYYSYTTIGDSVEYTTKVVGIINSNAVADQEIYLSYEIMQAMVNEQIEKYNSGELKIDEKAFDEYSIVVDYQPYGEVLFIDKMENVLSVQNKINNSSDTMYAYYEYQSILDLKQQNDELIFKTMLITVLVDLILVIGATIIELYYLRKYQSTYMIMKFIGCNKKDKKNICILHALYQLLICITISIFIYISGSASLWCRLLGYSTVDYLMNVPYLYVQYSIYTCFSLNHVIIEGVLMVLVIGLANIFLQKYYDKQSIVKWIRGK